ncbi:MAG: ABC transporter ATP-binding protein [Cellulosilyticaceae bacterium]
MFAIETVGLTKQYGAYRAVDELSIKIPRGAVCGFLGKNGAGKTTTIKMLVGLTRPTSGKITLMGEAYDYGAHDNSIIGYLPDVPNFYGYMTAREYLEFCGGLYSIEKGELKKRIDELLKEVGLNTAKNHIGSFSRGMKQRLGVAQALINKPQIIFMDEPISALDPIGRHEVMALIRSLSGKVTVFFSTHILADVETTCDYALILNKGKLLAADSIVNMKQKHASNTGVLRLFTFEDGKRFMNAGVDNKNILVEQRNALEFLVRGNTPEHVAINVSKILVDANISMQSYGAYVPSLEDIFMEVTADE